MYTELRTRAGLSVGLALLVSSAVQARSVLYVDDDAGLGGDGATWATAYKYLQDALSSAGDGTVIHVAQGIYVPDQDEAGNVTPGDRTATFQLTIGVALMGGFAGILEPDPDVRDVDLYETVLSGDLLGNDLPGFVNNAENSLHVVTGSGTDPSAVLDGVTITAGNANGPGWPALGSSGAGILNDTGSPTVTHCRVTDNVAQEYGGGMENLNGSSPAVSNTVFTGNASGITGAGMDNSFNAEPTVTECIFERNAVEETFPGSGGGIYSYQSHPTILDCIFIRNTARDGAGLTNEQSGATISGCEFTENMVSFVGAGIVNAYGASPTITNCSFTRNVATLDAGGNGGLGGAIINWDNCNPDISTCVFTMNYARYNGGAMYNRDGSSPTVTACSFIRNDAQDFSSGAIRNYNSSSPTVTDCTFEQNSAGTSGGAMRNDISSSPIVTDCTFDGNTAGGNGGAIMSYDNCNLQLTNCMFIRNAAGNRSGGLRDGFDCNSTLTNCTFNQNSAGQAGGAITAGSDTAVPVGHTELHNCILWDNTAPLGPEIALIGNFPAEVTVSYSDVQGGEAAVHVQPGFTLNWGAGNIDADPAFVDAVNGDLHLLSGSPAIDAGHNWLVAALASTDFDGNPRFADDPATPDTGCGVPVVVDMGAYEYQGNPFPVKFGDVDGDGIVGITDFLLLLGTWGSCVGDCCLADLDLDGNVGITDFLLMLANWG
jgi:predicted outer membrane repeat protein